MIKPLLIGSLIMGASTLAFADNSGPGCGWGSMLFEGSSGTPSHVVAATTNGTSGNNTFGMTSGTNGCDTSKTLDYKGTSAVVFHNMDRLSNDIAKGEGEILDTVASVMGIESTDVPTFKRVLHENFDTLYPTSEVTSEQVVNAIITVMSQEQSLAKYI
jgi:Protein of unknown function (DUF3015)